MYMYVYHCVCPCSLVVTFPSISSSLHNTAMQMIKRHIVSDIVERSKVRIALFMLQRQQEVCLYSVFSTG